MSNVKQTQKIDYRNNYNVLDSNKSFLYVMLINAFIAILLTAVFAVIANVMKINYGDFLDTRFANFVSICIIPISFFILFLYYNKKNKINGVNALGLKNKVNIWFILFAIAMALLCICAFAPIINLINVPFEALGYNPDGSLPYVMDTWWRIILGLVGYALIPAIFEELIFRGIMLKGLLRKCTPFCAIFISSAAFVIMHGSLQQTFYQIILGASLGILAYIGGSIVYAMIFHFVNNAVVVLMEVFGELPYMREDFLSPTTFMGIFFPIILTFVGIALLVGIFYLMKYMRDKRGLKNQIIVEGENVIIEEKNKVHLKGFLNSLRYDEKSYFLLSWALAIGIWLFSTIDLFIK